MAIFVFEAINGNGFLKKKKKLVETASSLSVQKSYSTSVKFHTIYTCITISDQH